MNNYVILVLGKVKYLRETIDSCRSFRYHIQTNAASIKRMVNIIGKIISNFRCLIKKKGGRKLEKKKEIIIINHSWLLYVSQV